jgi:protein-arginine kinase activator protein McsA
MLCESCHQREATVHLSKNTFPDGLDQPPTILQAQHFCPECADNYFACTPEMNSDRDLICLSDFFRSKLYDLLEKTHPEAFDNSTTEACHRTSELMRNFLREQLSKAKIEVNEDAFEMLCSDFFCSHHYYCRAEEVNRRKK